MDYLSLLSEILSFLSILLSVGAIFIALRIARADRATSNSWETYQEYQGEVVRKGRDLALKIKRDTGGKGFNNYTDYSIYFQLDLSPDSDHARQRQFLHDLAAFYHHTGALLLRGGLDLNFTLLLVGPGLEDRWPVLKAIADFYETDSPSGAFPYGGVYLLYDMYLKWKTSRYKKLRRRFDGSRNYIRKILTEQSLRQLPLTPDQASNSLVK